MPMKALITFMPEGKSAQVRPGTTVLLAAGKARVHIRTRCGGNAACLMCKIKAAPGSALSPPQANELRKLGALKDEGYRLACQARVEGDCAVSVPEDPLRAAIRRQLEQNRERQDMVRPGSEGEDL